MVTAIIIMTPRTWTNEHRLPPESQSFWWLTINLNDRLLLMKGHVKDLVLTFLQDLKRHRTKISK